MNWIFDILIASIFVSASYLTVKYAILQSNNDNALLERVFILIALTMGFLALCIIILFSDVRNNVIKDIKNIEISKWIILSGLCILISYFYLFRGSVNAPNMGYARSVLTIDIIILTLCSALFFGAPISLTSFLGMICIIIGILLVSFYN